MGGILAAGNLGGVQSLEAKLSVSAHKETGACKPQTPDAHRPNASEQGNGSPQEIVVLGGFYRNTIKQTLSKSWITSTEILN